MHFSNAKPEMARQFRLSTSKLALTYPQCDADKDQVLARIHDCFGRTLKWAIVATENHQDGNKHLHVGIKLERRRDIRSSNMLDDLAGSHGNYQNMRDQYDWVRYIVKDGDFVSYGIDVQQFLERKKRRLGEVAFKVAKMVKAGKKLGDIDAEHPGFVMKNMDKIQKYIEWASEEEHLKCKEAWEPIAIENGMDPFEKSIAQYCNEIPKKKKFGTPHLFIYGPSGVGKTSLVRWLELYFRVYHVPIDEDFYDLYNDQNYDLIVLDEFRSQKKLQWMNSFLGGSTQVLRKKGAQVVKRKNLPVIILSNFSLRECYSLVDQQKFQTISRRLLQIWMDKPLSFLPAPYAGLMPVPDAVGYVDEVPDLPPPPPVLVRQRAIRPGDEYVPEFIGQQNVA